jgi:hypothetical protein
MKVLSFPFIEPFFDGSKIFCSTADASVGLTTDLILVPQFAETPEKHAHTCHPNSYAYWRCPRK